jgi:tungstate transport system substrate-binding protein
MFDRKRIIGTSAILSAALIGILFICAPVQARKQKPQALRLATTTSTVDSGLLDYLLPFFEKKYRVRVDVISVGTGQALKLGENGDVDVVLVHARELEDKFVADGSGVNRRDVMYNDFLIVGPKDDPAHVMGSKTALEAFRTISEKQYPFISRGDKSGTDVKEKTIWKQLGITPAGKWYIESGQGMGATLTLADELMAYTLVDRATFTSYKAKAQLISLFEGDPTLYNPYGVIAVNPNRNKYVKYDLAMKFVNWIISDKTQKLIGNYKMNGVQLYVPDAK